MVNQSVCRAVRFKSVVGSHGSGRLGFVLLNVFVPFVNGSNTFVSYNCASLKLFLPALMHFLGSYLLIFRLFNQLGYFVCLVYVFGC